MARKVTFNHNFGGRASATEFASIHVVSKHTDNVLHVIAEPSEFRVRENGTVTIYSRKHQSTSVYGLNLRGREVIGISRDGSTITLLDL